MFVERGHRLGGAIVRHGAGQVSPGLRDGINSAFVVRYRTERRPIIGADGGVTPCNATTDDQHVAVECVFMLIIDRVWPFVALVGLLVRHAHKPFTL
jgi:hypothetical protein